MAVSSFPGSGFTALLPVAAVFAGDSGFGGSLPFDAVPGRTALLPVAPDLNGGSLAEVAGPGFVSDAGAVPALGDGVTGDEDCVAAGDVALDGTALLPLEPGLAGDALGLADVSDGFPELAGLPPLEPGPDAVGFDQPVPEDGVALGGTALLPVGPGLAGAELGLAGGLDVLP